ncbi:hypothetical protein F8388_006342 [Cannabis sativa]|uniref:Uncharacterized protein n=1 Tax=Cannabis sativa TaxID=3483 RepID=A0A7J6EDR3_CANSA|nr:hypothetical protein F8388_006342 [Cannabis sativa]
MKCIGALMCVSGALTSGLYKGKSYHMISHHHHNHTSNHSHITYNWPLGTLMLVGGSWRLGWNLQLLTIVYSGALGTAATFCLLTWAISIKGATYLSMFNSLGLIFVFLSEAVIFGVAITAGM